MTNSSKADLIVSIHDVTQHNCELVSEMLEQLHEAGAECCSLLVVPNHHKHGVISDNFEFCNWMQKARGNGHEIVAHGFYHLRDPRPDETFRERLVTGVYTRGEGEFFDLSEFEAEYRLKLVKASFRVAGIETPGFIAPAWLLSEGTERALKTLGFDYTTRIGSIRDLKTRRNTIARSLVYSTSTALRRFCSLGWNALLFGKEQSKPLIRLGVHPPDIKYRHIWKQILGIVRRVRDSHKAITYGDYITRSRLEV
jgi:predicted deacetylase